MTFSLWVKWLTFLLTDCRRVEVCLRFTVLILFLCIFFFLNLTLDLFSSTATWECGLWLAVESEVVQRAISIWLQSCRLYEVFIQNSSAARLLLRVSRRLYELSLAWLLAVRLANSHDATLELFYFNQHSLGLPITRIYVPGEIHCVSASPACFPPPVSGTTQPRNTFFFFFLQKKNYDSAGRLSLGRFRANNN